MSGTVEFPNVRHILLTGQPGVGKTTVIIKIRELLTNMKLPIAGFYTKELRSGNSRTGFDVLTLDNKHGPLARTNTNLGQQQNLRAPKVGNYVVDLASFESIALPALCYQDNKSVLVIDEIGKMELFSQPFECKVKELFQNKKLIILATVPSKGRPIKLVETLKKLPSAVVIEVNFKNRCHLPDTIASSIKNTYQTIHNDK